MEGRVDVFHPLFRVTNENLHQHISVMVLAKTTPVAGNVSRFDELPIHKMLYYRTREPVTLEQLEKATNTTCTSSFNPAGKRQDCLASLESRGDSASHYGPLNCYF